MSKQNFVLEYNWNKLKIVLIYMCWLAGAIFMLYKLDKLINHAHQIHFVLFLILIEGNLNFKFDYTWTWVILLFDFM